jgi:hypothetical protein
LPLKLLLSFFLSFFSSLTRGFSVENKGIFRVFSLIFKRKKREKREKEAKRESKERNKEITPLSPALNL